MLPYFETRREKIDARLDELACERPESPHAHLFSAARYSLFSGGKRIRPLLVFAAGEAFHAPIEALIDPACALEILHTYSLIHDDLPCMDNDDFRRGKPTLHKVYDEGHAVLTGDFLLTFAFEVLANAPHLSSDQKLSLIQILAKNAGADGMVGGQVIDVAHGKKEISLEQLELLHLKKTAALFSAALQFGGVIAKASTNDLALLTSIGTTLGLAFQIVDDLLDDCSAVQLLGKDKARAWADELSQKAIHSLASLSVPAPALLQLADELLYRTV